MNRYRVLLLFLAGIFFSGATVLAIEPTPEVKRQWKTQGFYKKYLQERAALSERGINTPARYAPDLRKIRAAGLRKSAETAYLNALIILVDFTDQLADSANTSAEFDTLLFSEGEHPTGSMNDWYLENSYGQVGINGVATAWLRMPENYSYYVNNQYGFGQYPNNAQKLTEDALAAADSFVDYSQFDNDGDGYVDALFVVHSGEGRETSGDSTDIHSHKWAISEPVTYDGVTLYEYTMEPELHGSSMVRMGVFGHEFGHALGLPDLYDTDYSSDGVGMWSMMAGGSWGGGGTLPVHFDAWCKATLGWLIPQNLTVDSTGISLAPVENISSAFRLWTEGQTGPEYFLVENRQQTGFDTSLPGSGLLIWHIDEAVSGNSNDWHKKVSLEQADGLDNLEHGNGSDGGDPFPGNTGNTSFTGSTDPNSLSYTGEQSFVAVTNISALGSTMTFDAAVSFQEPFISFQAVTVNDGNRNNALNRGEIDTLQIRVKNDGVVFYNVTVSLTSMSEQIEFISNSVQLDSMAGNSTVMFDSSFVVEVDSQATDWTVAPFTLEISGANNYSFSEEFFLIIDQGYGFQSEVESNVALWSHYAVSQGFMDEWSVSTYRNVTPGGSKSWKLGGYNDTNYSNSVDAALQTPVLRLHDTLDYELVFSHYMDAEIEEGSNRFAWDGGRVEISVDGGETWEILSPPTGYPYQIMDNPDSPFAANSPVYSGLINWEEVRVPLSDYSGDLAIRFRFGSDGYVTEEGWYIDDVSVQQLIGVDVASEDKKLPRQFTVAPNYPNPFNPSTTIPYTLPEKSTVRAIVYDLRGHKVATLVNTTQEAGKYSIQWNGVDQLENRVGSGVYFLRFSANEQIRVQKLTLIR